MNKIKVFISQPMREKSDEEILSERNKAAAEIKTLFGREDVEIISSFFIDDPELNGRHPLYLLGRSLQMLSESDYIYMCNGWYKARGCVIEFEAAREYGIKIIFQ